jgi:hypothetical protein
LLPMPACGMPGRSARTEFCRGMRSYPFFEIFMV